MGNVLRTAHSQRVLRVDDDPDTAAMLNLLLTPDEDQVSMLRS